MGTADRGGGGIDADPGSGRAEGVIDHERVTRTFPDGPGSVELVMIYEVQNEKIARAWVIAGAAKLAGGEDHVTGS